MDEALIAMDIEQVMRDLGEVNVAVALDVVTAAAFLDAQSFDFAILDINLGTTNSFAIVPGCSALLFGESGNPWEEKSPTVASTAVHA